MICCISHLIPPPNVKISVEAREHHGGGPACTAIAAVGMLQGRSAYSVRLGEDELSVYVKNQLSQRHVDTTYIIRDSEAAPYHSIITVDLEGNRNVFYDDSRFRPLVSEDLTDALILSSKLILLDHFSGSALTEVAKKIRSLGVPILGDIEGCSPSARQFIELIDHLIVPCEFALWASGSASPRDGCAYLAQTGRAATVVSAGSDGCYYTTGPDKCIMHFPASKIDAFDTNGCGDTFHGFALAVARDFLLEDAVLFASAAAAVKASGRNGTKRGWDALPTLKDIIFLLRSCPDIPGRSQLLKRIAELHPQ